MAKNDAKKTDASTAPINEFDFDAILNQLAPDDVPQLGLSYLYKPDLCQATNSKSGKAECAPIFGIPFRTETFDSANGEFTLVSIQLTKPTIGLNRERKALVVQPGSTVKIVATSALLPLVRAAENGARSWEMYLRPTGTQKVDIGNGRSMWEFDIRPIRALPKLEVAGELDMADLPPELQGNGSGAMGRQLPASA